MLMMGFVYVIAMDFCCIWWDLHGQKKWTGRWIYNQLMGVLYGVHAPTNGITIVNVVNHGKPTAINHPPDYIFYGWYCINYPQVQPTLLCFFGK